MFKQRSQILDFEEEALRIMHGDQNILFMTSTIRRQAASCIFGLTLASYYQTDMREKRFFPSPDWQMLPDDQDEERRGLLE